MIYNQLEITASFFLVTVFVFTIIVRNCQSFRRFISGDFGEKYKAPFLLGSVCVLKELSYELQVTSYGLRILISSFPNPQSITCNI